MIDPRKIRPRERRMLNNGRDMYHKYYTKGECRIMARKIRAWGFDVVDVTNKSLTYEVM